MGLTLRPDEMIRFLKYYGFEVIRIKGSHHRMSNGLLKTTIPVHNKDMKLGTIKGILNDCNIDQSELEKWLGR